MNVGYDLLTFEGDILRLRFWARAFEILKASGAVFLQADGRLAGCWVMRIEEAEGKSETPQEADVAAPSDEAQGDRPRATHRSAGPN